MKAAIFLSISVALLAGCGSGTKVVGKWEGSRDWKAIGSQNEEVSRALAGVMLELRANQTFVLQDGGVPFEGTYVVSGKDIRFDVLQIMNRPVGIQPEGTQKAAAFSAEMKNGKIYFRAAGEKEAVVLEPKAPEPARQ